MSSIKKVILALALILIPLQVAVAFEEPNQIMLGLDYPDSWLCVHHAGVYTVDLYLREAINPSFEGSGSRAVTLIGGFECKIKPYGDVMVIGLRYPVPAVNALTGDNYAVGYSEPIPAGLTTLLAQVDILIGLGGKAGTASAPAADKSPITCFEYSGHLVISPVDKPSIEGMMAYLDAEDTMDPIVGATRGSVSDADVWTEPEVMASERGAWGSVKAVFR